DPEKLAHQVAVVEAQSERPGIVYAAYATEWFDDPDRSNEVVPDPDPWAGVIGARFGITSANLYRRDGVLGVGGWDEGMRRSEDPDLAFRMLQAGARAVRDPRSLTRLRRRPDSLWNQDPVASTVAWLELRARVAAYLQ